MTSLTGKQNNSLTPGDTALGSPSYVAGRQIIWTGNFTATEAESNVPSASGIPNPIPISAFRQFLLSVISSAWGSASVTIKVYPCDSGGNKTGNAFFAITASSATTQIVFAQEMGGTTNSATYPVTAQTSGVVVGPLGSYLLLTETCTFTSGTNTVSIELDLKG